MSAAARMRAEASGEPELVDLLHRGRRRVIGAWLLGDVIVDPGPASCLPALLDALGERQPRALALTHIHLDHAGAAGSLVRRYPALEVWVHERGAPHMADPSKLLASATRLYGADMQRLWGEVLPVPPERIVALRGGETLAGMSVAYTPGHASHHVSYLDERSGWAFTGDVAGVRIDGGPTMAPTPPPDIDLAAWRESIALIERWQPTTLAVTHFGAHRDVATQLAELREHLDEVGRLAASEPEERFAAALRARVAALAGGRGHGQGSGAGAGSGRDDRDGPGAGSDPGAGSGLNADPDVSSPSVAEIAATYEQAMPPDQSYAGLRRYLDRAAAARGESER